MFVPSSGNDAFVYVPPRLSLAYLASILSRKRGCDIQLSGCVATNLCAHKWGGVSNSGATVLRLSLTLDDGHNLDLVAKILSPDPVNLFKVDRRFSSRLAEIAWAAWWGQQDVDFVPVTYDTRADLRAREFWIIREYFPQIGWPGFDAAKEKGMGHFSADAGRLRALMGHIALLHAYSRLRIEELESIFPIGGGMSVDACPSSMLRSWLEGAAADASFLSEIGVSSGERASLDAFGEALGHVPPWVERGDVVCVTADWGPDNFGIRNADGTELVNFDWGTTRLAPMEEDIDVLFMRLDSLGSGQRSDLLAHYLDVYASVTGHRIDPDVFRARIPWARYFVTLRYLVEHIEALRWVPYQTRSREFVHRFIGLCEKQLAECQTR
jgi:hypothetical protein